MPAPAVEILRASKSFRIGDAPYGTLRESIVRLFRGGRSAREPFWALRDVDLDFAPGDSWGLIGANGAGKTTLLRLIAGITRPSSGEVRVSGRVGSLIDVGAGLHPELTGRENVYFYGTLLGMRRKEIQARFATITEFADVGDFLDVPVKRYSAGMFMRLAFSVASHLDADILLLDEILAVGDIRFQAKCLARLRELRDGRRILVFVSHSPAVVASVCNRAAWIHQGRVEARGEPAAVIERYLAFMEHHSLPLRANPGAEADGPLRILGVDLLDGGGNPRDTFGFGESIEIRIRYEAAEAIPRPQVSLAIMEDFDTTVCTASTLWDGRTPDHLTGRGALSCRFESPSLLPRTYQIMGSIREQNGVADLLPWRFLASLRVDFPLSLVGWTETLAAAQSRAVPAVYVPYRWTWEAPEPGERTR